MQYKFNYFIILTLTASLCLLRISLAAFNWGAWSAWPITCSQTCGEGRRCRSRQCLDGFGKIRNLTQCAGSGEECMTCVVTSKCPRQPGWSSWDEWSDCVLNESKGKVKPDSQGCLPGTKFRSRLCNNPPPDPGPNSIYCSGMSREVKSCPYGCPDTPQIDDFNLKERIKQQVLKDHLATRVRRKSSKDYADAVVLRAPGDEVQFDCNTEAYRFAKDTIEARALSLSNMNLPIRKVAIFWQLGGRTVAADDNYVASKQKRITLPNKELVEEESQWISRLERTSPVIQGTKLILSDLKAHDTGLYTCHIKVSNEEWLATFYSLIVLGQQFSAPAQMPFYLHSNVGEWSAFEKGQVHWYDAARIQWNLNGEPMFTDLAIRPRARIRLIPYLSSNLQGQWDCHLIVPLPDAPTVQASRNVTFSSQFLVNSFFLRVTPRPPSLWELGDRPQRVSRLRLVALILTIASFALFLAVALTVWAVWRWVQKTPKLNQLESEVEEVVDDRTRLFINARQEARKRYRILLPFVQARMREISEMRKNPPSEEMTILQQPGVTTATINGKSENKEGLQRAHDDASQTVKMKGMKRLIQKLKFGTS